MISSEKIRNTTHTSTERHGERWAIYRPYSKMNVFIHTFHSKSTSLDLDIVCVDVVVVVVDVER